MESRELLIVIVENTFTIILFGAPSVLRRIKADAYTDMGLCERFRQ